MAISDYVHSGDFYDEFNTFDEDLPFYRAQCAEAGGRVLELCCGTGRLTLPLARDGVEIDGVGVIRTSGVTRCGVPARDGGEKP